MSTRQSRKEARIKGGGSGEGFSGWIENKLTFEFTNRRNFLAVDPPPPPEEDRVFSPRRREYRSRQTAGGTKRNTEQLPTHQAAATRGAALLPWQRFITDHRELERYGLTALHLPPTGKNRQRDEIILANSIKGNL